MQLKSYIQEYLDLNQESSLNILDS